MRENLPERMEHGGRVRWHCMREGGELIDFSANINPYPPIIPWTPDPSALKDYPDDRYEALKEVIGSTFGRDAAEITVGNGSVELIRAFCSAVLGEGETAAATTATACRRDVPPGGTPGTATASYRSRTYLHGPSASLLIAARVAGV